MAPTSRCTPPNEGAAAAFRSYHEGALVGVDIPGGLAGLFASRQSGAFVEASRTFGRGRIVALPLSSLTAVARAEAVDFDRDLAGDSQRAITLGLNFRPIPEARFKELNRIVEREFLRKLAS